MTTLETASMVTKATQRINDGTVRMILEDYYHDFEKTNVLVEPFLSQSVEYLTVDEYELCKSEWSSGRLRQALESRSNLNDVAETLTHRYFLALQKGTRKMRARTESYVNAPE